MNIILRRDVFPIKKLVMCQSDWEVIDNFIAKAEDKTRTGLGVVDKVCFLLSNHWVHEGKYEDKTNREIIKLN